MELTGKCASDFDKTLKNTLKFNVLSQSYKNRKIIEWFNSVGIKLTFNKSKLGGCVCYFSNEHNVMGWSYLDYQDKIIKKANEIYNERNI